MKGCFLLQRRFAYVGHAMVQTFKKKYGVNDFCAYILLRSSYNFLKNQKDIRYTNLILDEEVHNDYKKEKLDLNFIKQLESEYGIPNLWPYIDLDRVVRNNMFVREYPYDTPKYSHEEMMRILQLKARTVINFLEKEKPDFIVFSAIGGIPSLFLYYVAKKMGIKTFVILPSLTGNNWSLGENYNGLSFIEKKYDELNKSGKNSKEKIFEEKARKFLNDFRAKPSFRAPADSPTVRPINRIRQFNFLSPSKIFRSLHWTYKTIANYIIDWDAKKNDYDAIKPWFFFWDKIKRKVRVLWGFEDLYNEMTDEDFAYYPLQVDPEIASLLFAPFFSDQLWLIKQIARSLPLHYKLYIKEHPAMFGYRPRRFYKELKKIPNVKLIRPSVIGFNITQKAKILFTITGTTGWEAVLLKKPVITFGNIFYNKLPMVKKCVAAENLPHIIQEQLNRFNYDEEKLINFIMAIYQESAGVDMDQIWSIEGASQMEKKERELIPLVDLIAKKLDLKSVF